MIVFTQADVQSTMGVLFFVAINQGILGTIGVLQVTFIPNQVKSRRGLTLGGSVHKLFACDIRALLAGHTRLERTFHSDEIARIGGAG